MAKAEYDPTTSFILFTEHEASLSFMDDHAVAELFRAVIRYVKSGFTEIRDVPPTAAPTFALMRDQIHRKKEAYAEICEKNRQNAVERWKKMQAHATASDDIRPNTNDADVDVDEGVGRNNNIKQAFIPQTGVFKSAGVQEKWNQYIDVRISHGWKTDQRFLTGMMKQLEEYSDGKSDIAEKILTVSIERQYKGFFRPQFLNRNRSNRDSVVEVAKEVFGIEGRLEEIKAGDYTTDEEWGIKYNEQEEK